MSALALNTHHWRALALLRHGALIRDRNAWRFGATSVGDNVVAELVASRKAMHLFPGQIGECVVLLDRSRGAGR